MSLRIEPRSRRTPVSKEKANTSRAQRASNNTLRVLRFSARVVRTRTRLLQTTADESKLTTPYLQIPQIESLEMPSAIFEKGQRIGDRTANTEFLELEMIECERIYVLRLHIIR